MITFIRTFSIMPGKTAEALAFAHQVTKHVKETHGLDISLSMPVGGNPYRIAFVSVAPNMSELEANIDRLAKDAEWEKLIVGNAGNTIPGSVHDEIWRSL